MLLLPGAPAAGAGSMDVHWNEGAENCRRAPPPPLQVHRYDERTFIVRENPCVTSEAPFMYLLIGAQRALLIDSGDVASAAQVPLAQTVLALLPGSGAQRMPLLVLHTHGHLDHREGDVQFAGLPNVEVVESHLENVRRYFGFGDWPAGTAQVELGGRTVDVLPTPGHYDAEVSYYDRNTGLLFSGDFLLPGRLIIADRAADLASAQRATAFAHQHPITYVLGGHVEMDAGGELYGFTSSYRPNQHALQLTQADLLALPALVAQFNGFYTRRGNWVMYDQNRMLGVFAALLLAALAGVVLFIVRRRRSDRTPRRP
jgi:glyoxylase-like metal-dependent hydrolase (beta-lactamase superfamily II)